MKSIECINFVSDSAPNILLIADIDNNYTQGFHLKHFKISHNIYAFTHNQDNNFEWYYDLTSKHSQIVQELDKYNLQKFIIYTISFGGFIAFYLMFYFPERVSKAIIHDFHFDSCSNDPKSFFYVPNISTQNWNIPKNIDIPILLLMHKGKFINKKQALQIASIFINLKFILFINKHSLMYKSSKIIHNFFFFIFNMKTINQFWNIEVKNFILSTNPNKINKINRFLAYIFLNFVSYYKN